MSARSTRQPRPPRHESGIGIVSLVVLVLLVALPGYALSRVAVWIDWRILAGTAVAVSLFTYFSYRSDKRRAESAQWRIPESTLHLCELLGGWPGAFFAQRKFRHKTAKSSYQVTFWAIVLIHQYLALDFLMDWRFAREAMHVIRSSIT